MEKDIIVCQPGNIGTARHPLDTETYQPYVTPFGTHIRGQHTWHASHASRGGRSAAGARGASGSASQSLSANERCGDSRHPDTLGCDTGEGGAALAAAPESRHSAAHSTNGA